MSDPASSIPTANGNSEAPPSSESFCCAELGRDVELPLELLQLPSLEGVLSMDSWNSLTSEEQQKLLLLLPQCESADQTATVQAALTGTDKLLGTSAPTRCFGMMKSGLLHPTVAEHRKRARELTELQHTYDVRDHHNKMVYSLLKYKDSIRSECDSAAADSFKTKDAVPPSTPRHPWAVPLLEAIHRILHHSPQKQAKFDHLLEIVHSSLLPTRQQLDATTEENPLRFMCRAALLFLCSHPAEQPHVQPSTVLSKHGDFYWNSGKLLRRPELVQLGAQFSQQLHQSAAFQQQVWSTVSMGSMIAAATQPGQANKKTRLEVTAKKTMTTKKAPMLIMSNEDATREFHKQEYARYTNPYRPFRYIDAISGHTTVVAPLRKASAATSSKGRDHNVLAPERAPHVTVLALVRDAAARLPNGIGSKDDICSLLRMSQYMLPEVTDSHMGHVVSNALDRLLAQHVDPCVEYCHTKKHWIYKHLHRSETDFINKRGQPTNRPNIPATGRPQTSPNEAGSIDQDASDVSEMSQQESDGDDDME